MPKLAFGKSQVFLRVNLMNKYILIIIVLLITSAGVVFYGNQKNWFKKDVLLPSNMIYQLSCEHKLAVGTCAFCDETLIESLGFCHGHDVPEAFCTRCNSDLIIAFKTLNDWCEAHSLPESQCSICDPHLHKDKTATMPEPSFIGPTFNSNAAQPQQLCEHKLAIGTCAFCDEALIESLGFCHGHDVPEAFCTRCNSDLIIAFKTLNDWCEAHTLPKSQCYICDPHWHKKNKDNTIATEQSFTIKPVADNNVLRNQAPPATTCATESLQVNFPSAQTAVNAGFEYESIVKKVIPHTITSYVQVAYNAHRFAHLSPRAAGVITQVNHVLGDTVKTGTTLALIDSSDLGTAKSQYLQSNALVKLWEENFKQEKLLFEKHATTTRDALEAQTKLTESKISLTRNIQRLKNLGLDDQQIKAIIKKNNTSSLLSLKAPFGGIIIERDSVIGEVVNTSKPLFAIADTSKMWATLEINETETQNIKVGQHVVVSIESLIGIHYSGTIHWVSTHIDPKTRMLKARVELANDNNLLKAGMFGKATITIKDKTPSLVVPKSAVQWEGCCNIVFIQINDNLFSPRKISIDFETDHHYVVSGNIHNNETVVTTGSFLLKTEILKGSIGAGCCEVSPGK